MTFIYTLYLSDVYRKVTVPALRVGDSGSMSSCSCQIAPVLFDGRFFVFFVWLRRASKAFSLLLQGFADPEPCSLGLWWEMADILVGRQAPRACPRDVVPSCFVGRKTSLATRTTRSQGTLDCCDLGG